MSDEESVKEAGNEEGIASDQNIKTDTVSQEEERKQSLYDTGMCTLYSSKNWYPLYSTYGPVLNSSTEEIKETEIGKACALNGEMKGLVESSKNSHTAEGWPT